MMTVLNYYFLFAKMTYLESQERTKFFFDYIIPIIPAVTASNSTITFTPNSLHDMNLHNDLGRRFFYLTFLCTWWYKCVWLIIFVMNIWCIKETLNILTLNCEKLFMVVYKNIFLKDFLGYKEIEVFCMSCLILKKDNKIKENII